MRIKVRYYQLGIALGLPPRELEAIQQIHSHNVAQALTQVLLIWLRQRYNVEKFGRPTWQRLREAVDSPSGGENSAFAEKIAKKHIISSTSHHSNLSFLSLSLSWIVLHYFISLSTVTTRSHAAGSPVTQPGVMQPGVKQPWVPQPGVTQPEVKQPGITQPEFMQPWIPHPQHGVTQPAWSHTVRTHAARGPTAGSHAAGDSSHQNLNSPRHMVVVIYIIKSVLGRVCSSCIILVLRLCNVMVASQHIVDTRQML